jgi:alanine racemase
VSCSLARESFVATLAAGYSDGVPRSLSNKGQVLISGQRCPILGTVCMDYLMVDVTELAATGSLPVRGAEAVLIGQQGTARISVEEVAFAAGTVPHDVLCRVGDRVKMKYLPMAASAGTGLQSDNASGRWQPSANASAAVSSRHRRTA